MENEWNRSLRNTRGDPALLSKLRSDDPCVRQNAAKQLIHRQDCGREKLTSYFAAAERLHAVEKKPQKCTILHRYVLGPFVI